MKRINLLSVDLEDWYTSAYLRDYVRPENCIPQITASTPPILEIFNRKKIKATFFVLGLVAEKHPELIREIHRQGHEIASHGYSHTPLWDLTPETFRNEIKTTNSILQDITEKKVKGFRAPYASLEQKTAWAINILEEEGFEYDSSIFPMRTPLYGVDGAPDSIYRISADNILKHQPDARIIEIPFTVFTIGGFKIPCTGGIYGRLLPYFILKFLLKRVEKKNPLNFYFHPWETYKNIPRLDVPLYNKFVTYANVSNYLDKIEKLTELFNFTSFENYLSLNE